jgi:hypothetical protein
MEPAPKKRTIRKRKPAMKRPLTSEIDLTGFYRMDLKTLVMVILLAGSWYDSRAQEQRRTAVDQERQQQTAQALNEQKSLIKILQLDVTNLQLELAKLSPRKERS